MEREDEEMGIDTKRHLALGIAHMRDYTCLGRRPTHKGLSDICSIFFFFFKDDNAMQLSGF